MSRKLAAALTAACLLVGVGLTAFVVPVPYVRLSPGPTVDVLGTTDGRQEIVQIKGRRSYPDNGQLRLVTVFETGPQGRMNLFEALTAWAIPSEDLFPREIVYPEGTTEKGARQESAAQMDSSQNLAIAAALSALDIDYTSSVVAVQVSDDGPAAGKLKAGDELVSVDGATVANADSLVGSIQQKGPDKTLQITVRRGGKTLTVPVTTVKSPDDPKQGRVGISIGIRPEFPFDVDIKLSDSIGGPSAGLIFALSIYDRLTPGSLTDGKVIAGTGTITETGQVGPIGGIAQKVSSAQRDGAKLFLVPADNCAEAADASYDPDRTRLVKVSTLTGAIKAIESWTRDPNAALPRCSGE